MAVDYVSGAGETLSDRTGDETGPAKAQPQGDSSAQLAQKWNQELQASKKWLAKFSKNGHECEQAYLDERDRGSAEESRVNLFWSNTQVVLSAIYGRLPKAEVKRKFDDFDDDVARVAAMILERILNGDIEREYDDTAAAMRDAVFDRFVAGLGQVWCRYDVETEQYEAPVLDPATQQPQLDAAGQPVTQTAERILNEEAEVDYVYWDDFRYSPCRRWRDVRWVARRVYMSRKALKERFTGLSDVEMNLIPMITRTPGPDGGGDADVLKATPFSQAAVWEIWDKPTNAVCWHVEGCSFVLDVQPDLLKLDDFFPCPQPIVASTLTRAFLPRADYAMAQDLYKQLDAVNARIARLTQAIKAVGVYDKNADGVKAMLSANIENTLLPVDSWSSFVERGGLKGMVDWLPIEQYVNAVVQLQTRKQELQKDLYDVLGISDIMRGTSVASETATAQQLKAQFGGARLNSLQGDVGRFVSDVMRIRANIVANQFQPQTMLARSAILRTPDAQLAQDAIQLIQNFGLAQMQVLVTADSLAAPDWETEKQTRTEFMGAVSNYLMAAGPMVTSNPMTGSFLIKLLQWGAAGFKGSESIEGVLDEAARQLDAAAQQPPPPPPPTPEDQKNLAQADKAKADAGKSQADAERSQAETARTAEETRAMRAQNNALFGQGNPAGTPGASGPQMPVPGAPFTPSGGARFGATPGALPPPGAGAAPGTPGGPGGMPPLPNMPVHPMNPTHLPPR